MTTYAFTRSACLPSVRRISVILLLESSVRAPASRGLVGPPQAFRVSGELPGDVVLRASLHGREEVPRGVDVAVVDGAAQAHPRPVRQGQLGVDRPAPGARLGTRVPAVGRPHLRRVPASLVLQLPDELTEPGIGDGAGKLAIADHPGDVQRLDGDGAFGSREPRREL